MSELLDTMKKRFNRAMDAISENRTYQLDDLKFAAGSPDNLWQWHQDAVRNRQADPSSIRPILTINQLPQHINQICNDQRQNRPAVKVLPVDDEGNELHILSQITLYQRFVAVMDVSEAVCEPASR